MDICTFIALKSFTMPGFELFGDEERKEVNDVLNTGILMRYGFDGPRKGIWKSKELEAALCKRLGSGYAQLTSSGTSALTTALAALGVGAGDEVIMPTFTFVASFEAVLSLGASPVLADIDETLTIHPESAAKLVNNRTKCLMPVHMCGSMADLDSLIDIATKNNLVLLEDACQSIGASYKGKSLGTIGHAGCLSFDFVKTITCAEGGAVLTHSHEIYQKCDGFSDHGHDHIGNDRGAELHPFLGYNFRISELHAAVGLAQFRKLDQFLTIQKKNHQQLQKLLSQVPEISFRKIPDPSGDSFTFLSWFMPSEELTVSLMQELKAQGIAAGNFYWYDHNWHYIRKWDHLKKAISLYNLSGPQLHALQKISKSNYHVSDRIMNRCISTSVSLLWNEEQTEEKGKKLVAAVKKILSRQPVSL
jgi:8-amino-3,8-dideoxy-alpha-D-manno-octulosonate transaminase